MRNGRSIGFGGGVENSRARRFQNLQRPEMYHSRRGLAGAALRRLRLAVNADRRSLARGDSGARKNHRAGYRRRSLSEARNGRNRRFPERPRRAAIIPIQLNRVSAVQKSLHIKSGYFAAFSIAHNWFRVEINST